MFRTILLMNQRIFSPILKADLLVPLVLVMSLLFAVSSLVLSGNLLFNEQEPHDEVDDYDSKSRVKYLSMTSFLVHETAKS